jgi:formate--tetrahydrofolate ligase
VLDVNDRALRNIVIGLGGKVDGVVRQTGFDITAASEVMASARPRHLDDGPARPARPHRRRLHEVGEPITAEQLSAAGSMAVILRDALKPNLLQTIEHTPVIVHTGPFGNIATGNSSVIGDLIGIRTGDYLITEAGFGADMGAERFFNIKCRTSGSFRMPPCSWPRSRAEGALGQLPHRGGQAAARRAARRSSGRRRSPVPPTCASRSRT